MKYLRLVFYAFIFFAFIYLFILGNRDVTITQSFMQMINSNDEQTRLTAIIIFSEIEDDKVQSVLENYFLRSKDVERIAIIYSLFRHDGKFEQEFIESIPIDEQEIKKLLFLDSPQGSHLRAPYLRIIKSVGDLAMHNDTALDKLKLIYRHSDGWRSAFDLSFISFAVTSRIVTGMGSSLPLTNLAS
jgi:hypothetical protein